MIEVRPEDLLVRPFHVLDEEWALLASGAERPNLMTVSWGGLGTLWNRPVATVYVRPVRYTFELLAALPEFTLNVLPARHRDALAYCGEHTGRDADKWAATGLWPAAPSRVRVPRVAQAELVLECRVLATLDIDPERFLDPALHEQYPARDYHRVFLGEVVAAAAAERFARLP
ncbi:MAG: flavin reductase family protein [Acidobacteria bacterium]|nr:flavin reductase family protein [Acidobacteriota bacterium]